MRYNLEAVTILRCINHYQSSGSIKEDDCCVLE